MSYSRYAFYGLVAGAGVINLLPYVQRIVFHAGLQGGWVLALTFAITCLFALAAFDQGLEVKKKVSIATSESRDGKRPPVGSPLCNLGLLICFASAAGTVPRLLQVELQGPTVLWMALRGVVLCYAVYKITMSSFPRKRLFVVGVVAAAMWATRWDVVFIAACILVGTGLYRCRGVIGSTLSQGFTRSDSVRKLTICILTFAFAIAVLLIDRNMEIMALLCFVLAAAYSYSFVQNLNSGSRNVI